MILKGETKLTASEEQKFNLDTMRNVSKNKKILEEKKVVVTHDESITFKDPVFEYWLKSKYKPGSEIHTLNIYRNW